MKTSADWLRELEELYDGQKAGRIKPVQAVEMNNTVGKVIALTKLQLEYARVQATGKAPRIALLENTEVPA